jgi:hypothetical protein
MKNRTLSILLTAFAVLSSPAAHAGEGSEGHSGGGMWVCRGADHSIQWSSLVDIWEAYAEYGLELRTGMGTYGKNDFLAQIRGRLQHMDALSGSNVSVRLAPYLSRVNGLEPGTPQMIFTSDVVKVIDDSNFDLSPDASKYCAGGSLAYEQVVNYRSDGWIVVQQELFNHLDGVSQAALVYHEAIYALARAESQQKTSRFSRRVVGLLFSTLSDQDAMTQIEREIRGDKTSAWPYRFGSLNPGTAVPGRALAIAFNSTNASLGASWNYSTPAEAERRALSSCASGLCRAISTTQWACMAFAVESLHFAHGAAFGGPTRDHAERGAVLACSQQLGTPCTLAVSVCNGT